MHHLPADSSLRYDPCEPRRCCERLRAPARSTPLCRLRDGLRGLGTTDSGEPARIAAARRGLDDTLAFADVLNSIDEDEDRGFPDTDLGWQLRLAGGLLGVLAGGLLPKLFQNCSKTAQKLVKNCSSEVTKFDTQSSRASKADFG